MKYWIALIVLAWTASESLAVNCADLPNVFKSNFPEFERLLTQYESVTLDDAEQCRFALEETLPAIRKMVDQLESYKNCELEYLARKSVDTWQQTLETLEVEYTRSCK